MQSAIMEGGDLKEEKKKALRGFNDVHTERPTGSSKLDLIGRTSYIAHCVFACI